MNSTVFTKLGGLSTPKINLVLSAFLIVNMVMAINNQEVQPSDCGRRGEFYNGYSCTKTCPSGYYGYLGNATCLRCDYRCGECIKSSISLTHSCASCSGMDFYQQAPPPGNSGKCVSNCGIQGLYAYRGISHLRLVGGVDKFEGRVEIYYNNTWNTLCDDNWISANTDVICSELGYVKGIRYHTHSFFGESSLPMLLDEVVCHGNEQSILSCAHNRVGRHDCVQGETIGLRCAGPHNRRRCVEACPVGVFSNSKQHSCDTCSSKCLDCQTMQDVCIMCEEPKFLTGEGKCEYDCPRGYYGNILRQTCEKCHRTCATCANGVKNNLCLTCANTQSLYLHQCHSTCPVGTYSMVYTNQTVKCLENCPSSYFIAEATCQHCSNDCYECAGSPNNCTSCFDDNVLQPQTSSTSITYFECQSHCNMGYNSDAKGTCWPCHDPKCQECYTGGAYCSKCEENLKVELLKCVQECSKGLYAVNGVCQPHCLMGYYPDLGSMACLPCHLDGCLSCSTSDVCDTCHPPFYLNGTSCVIDCSPQVALTNPPANDVRLVGSHDPLIGRVELLYQGVWGSVCADGFSMTTAHIICKQLSKGRAVQSMRIGGVVDDEGGGAVAVARQLLCSGVESSVWDCQHDVPTQWLHCPPQGEVAGVRCSGPDLSQMRECRVGNKDNCYQRPCAEGVTCQQLPHSAGSYCGSCPNGFHGNGKICREIRAPSSPRLVFPASSLTTLLNWPEKVDAILPCVIRPSQGAIFEWRHNGLLIKTQEMYKVGESGSLYLYAPTRHQSGRYTCVASNSKGAVRTQYDLTVQERVEISSTLEAEHQPNGSIILPCNHSGYPVPTVTWFKDGDVINVGMVPHLHMMEDGSLLIDGIYGDAMGTYRCLVTNNITSSSNSTVLDIKAAPVIKKASGRHLVAVLGDDFRLPCHVTGSPVPSISWKKNRNPIQNDPHIQVDTAGTLNISDVQETDGAIYTCHAQNSLGRDIWDANVTVMVFASGRVNPARITRDQGEDVTFICEGSARPVPTVTWVLPNGTVSLGRRMDSNAELSVKSRLTMTNLSESDSGHVICNLTNPAGSLSLKSRLIVTVAPRFVKEPYNMSLLGGWNSLVDWGIYGVPEPVILWYRGNAPLNQLPGYSVGTAGIMFRPVFPADAGSYRVTASNSQGQITGAATVTIIENYPPPGVFNTNFTGASVDFSGIPSAHAQAEYQVVVVRLGVNGTRGNLTTSPLLLTIKYYTEILRNDHVNTSHAYVTAYYRRLPATDWIGSDTMYHSDIFKVAVRNSVLLRREWFAVCVRIVQKQNGHQIIQGASHYSFFYTAPQPDVDDAGVIAGAIIGVLIAVSAVALGILWYRGKIHFRCSHSGAFRTQGSTQKVDEEADHDSVLDVEEIMEQFTPKPSPQTESRHNDGSTYIPTEDEIDAMDTIGINYYEDENWLSHVPEGVLSESKEDLVTKIYDQRRLSRLGDASVSMQELSTSLPPGQREKFSREPPPLPARLSASMEHMAQITTAVIHSASTHNEPLPYFHPRLTKTPSKDSKNSDSGFESDRLTRSTSRIFKGKSYRDIMGIMAEKMHLRKKSTRSSFSGNIGTRKKKKRERKQVGTYSKGETSGLRLVRHDSVSSRRRGSARDDVLVPEGSSRGRPVVDTPPLTETRRLSRALPAIPASRRNSLALSENSAASGTERRLSRPRRQSDNLEMDDTSSVSEIREESWSDTEYPYDPEAEHIYLTLLDVIEESERHCEACGIEHKHINWENTATKEPSSDGHQMPIQSKAEKVSSDCPPPVPPRPGLGPKSEAASGQTPEVFLYPIQRRESETKPRISSSFEAHMDKVKLDHIHKKDLSPVRKILPTNETSEDIPRDMISGISSKIVRFTTSSQHSGMSPSKVENKNALDDQAREFTPAIVREVPRLRLYTSSLKSREIDLDDDRSRETRQTPPSMTNKKRLQEDSAFIDFSADVSDEGSPSHTGVRVPVADTTPKHLTVHYKPEERGVESLNREVKDNKISEIVSIYERLVPKTRGKDNEVKPKDSASKTNVDFPLNCAVSKDKGMGDDIEKGLATLPESAREAGSSLHAYLYDKENTIDDKLDTAPTSSSQQNYAVLFPKSSKKDPQSNTVETTIAKEIDTDKGRGNKYVSSKVARVKDQTGRTSSGTPVKVAIGADFKNKLEALFTERVSNSRRSSLTGSKKPLGSTNGGSSIHVEQSLIKALALRYDKEAHDGNRLKVESYSPPKNEQVEEKSLERHNVNDQETIDEASMQSSLPPSKISTHSDESHTSKSSLKEDPVLSSKTPDVTRSDKQADEQFQHIDETNQSYQAHKSLESRQETPKSNVETRSEESRQETPESNVETASEPQLPMALVHKSSIKPKPKRLVIPSTFLAHK